MITDLIRDLAERGAKLEVRNGDVVVRAPIGAIPIEMRRALAASKAELLACLTLRDEQRLATECSPSEPEPLEAVLKGRAIELWSDVAGECLWLMADEEDALKVGEPRGLIYSAAEARLVCRITDPAVVREVHSWKRQFNARVSEFRSTTLPGDSAERQFEPINGTVSDEGVMKSCSRGTASRQLPVSGAQKAHKAAGRGTEPMVP